MKNIFVVGLDDFHLAQLQTLPGAAEYAFHALFSHAELKQQERFPVARLLQEGLQQLRQFNGRVDAVIGYWDFPVSTSLPILRRALGLPGPSLEAVLQCEHKYWSRLRQAEVAPEHVPAFCGMDPFAADPLARVTLPFPFWLKPVKSVLSHLGFRIDDERDFQHAIGRIRRQIDRYAEPFNLILEHARLPPRIAPIDGRHCIAEAIISAGRQCTLEGYAYGGEVEIYGAIDSLRGGPRQSSFSRYQYPSNLPAAVQQHMHEITARVMRHLGFDTGPFNIEFFWDQDRDALWLLEINPRISKSHAPLFHLVDGCYHHQVMVDLGLGRAPRFPQGGGECRYAAKFMVRRFEDARVTRAPHADEVAAVEAAMPHCQIQLEVREGMRLSELRDQDSYSYEVATVFLGADSPAALEQNFETCMQRLPLRFAPLEDD